MTSIAESDRRYNNCNLDLRLSLPPPATAEETTHDCFNQQQLTVFYNGRIIVRDVTEIQARAIIWQASKEVEQGRYNDREISPIANAYSSPAMSSDLPISMLQQRNALSSSSSSSSGLSMKNSLRSFLQKRKHRQMAASPYNR
ncbi:hypothetical protein V2J09_010208 [Rumex salicifolius]